MNDILVLLFLLPVFGSLLLAAAILWFGGDKRWKRYFRCTECGHGDSSYYLTESLFREEHTQRWVCEMCGGTKGALAIGRDVGWFRSRFEWR